MAIIFCKSRINTFFFSLPSLNQVERIISYSDFLIFALWSDNFQITFPATYNKQMKVFLPQVVSQLQTITCRSHTELQPLNESQEQGKPHCWQIVSELIADMSLILWFQKQIVVCLVSSHTEILPRVMGMSHRKQTITKRVIKFVVSLIPKEVILVGFFLTYVKNLVRSACLHSWMNHNVEKSP